MTLIKTIDEVQDYLPVNITAKIEQITPYVIQAEDRYLKYNYLGEDLFDELQGLYDSDGLDADYTKLLRKVQRALVNFAYYLAVSNLNLNITSAGFSVTSTQNLAPASQQRTDALKRDLERAGYDGIESLLRFLEKNTDVFPLWVSSDAYTEHYRFFLRNADEFNKEVEIGNSSLLFMRMRPTMKHLEKFKIEPVISAALSAEIKSQIKTDNLSEANQAILPHLRSALANFTIAQHLDPKLRDTQDFGEFALVQNKLINQTQSDYEGIATAYLTEVKKVLDAAPDDYPLYKNSDSYDADKTSYDYDSNEDTNHDAIFIMGGPR